MTIAEQELNRQRLNSCHYPHAFVPVKGYPLSKCTKCQGTVMMTDAADYRDALNRTRNDVVYKREGQ